LSNRQIAGRIEPIKFAIGILVSNRRDGELQKLRRINILVTVSGRTLRS
jgi:hypothetical protein